MTVSDRAAGCTRPAAESAPRQRNGRGLAATPSGEVSVAGEGSLLTVVVRQRGRHWRVELPEPHRAPRGVCSREAAQMAAAAFLAEHGGGDLVMQTRDGQIIERLTVPGLPADAATVTVRHDTSGEVRLIGPGQDVDLIYSHVDAATRTARELLVLFGGGRLLIESADSDVVKSEVVPRPLWWVPAANG